MAAARRAFAAQAPKGAPARIGLALLSAVLLTIAFPSPDLGAVAWIALAPLTVACAGGSAPTAFGLGLVSGSAAALGVYHWMFRLEGFGAPHAILLGLYLALYPAVWCAGSSVLWRGRVPALLTIPALWVALDYVRAHAGFLAIPWAALAHSQHLNIPVLQVARMTGEAGVTFLVVLGSVAAAALWTGRARLGAVAAAMAILAAHGIGSLLLARPAPAERTLLVAAVQPSILRAERSEAGSAATLERLIRLTRLAAAGKPDLTAWPETAVEDLSSRPQVARRIEQLTRETGMPLLVGASGLEMLPARDQPGGRALASRNDAYLLWPGRHFGAPYRKMRLVPFGEYLPLAPGGKWPPWLTSDFLPSIPGPYRRPFWLPDGTRLGVLICWENLFPDFVRSWVRDGSRLLVHLTNDNWFGPTGAPRQHNLASVLRAVENGVPVLIASNTGPSQVIDPRGRVLAEESRLFSEGIVAARVPVGEGGTFYTRWGDLFSVLCAATAAAGIASRFLPGPAAKRRGPNTPGQVHRLLLGTAGPR